MLRQLSKFFEKKATREQIEEYFTLCKWIGQKLLDPPVIEKKEIIKRLTLTTTISAKKVFEESKGKYCAFSDEAYI